MKKIILLGLVLLMVVVFATTVFGAAQKSDLIYDPGAQNANPSGDVVVGFAIINNPSNPNGLDGDNLIVVVSLKKCEQVSPDTTYGVYLEGYYEDDVWYGEMYIGDLVTDKLGKGTAEFKLYAPVPPGTYKIQIVVGASWAFGTTAVDIEVK